MGRPGGGGKAAETYIKSVDITIAYAKLSVKPASVRFCQLAIVPAMYRLVNNTHVALGTPTSLR